MKKYRHIQEPIASYGVRDLSRGKLTEAIKVSLSQPVIILKNNKPESVIISYEEYIKLAKEKKQ